MSCPTRHARRILFLTSMAAVCVANSACSRRLLGVLVDMPPEAPGVASEAEGSVTVVGGQPIPTLTYQPVVEPADTATPAIELTLDPDSVVKMLPRDHAGNLDWVAAMRQGIIHPRDGKDGPREWGDGFEFGFDFYFPGPTQMFDAFFPHSAHTELLECAQCHPRIFRSRGNEIKMADVLQGRFCGECHGKVAFPPATACERCHTDLPQPPDRAQPLLLGTVQMRRATDILAAGDSSATVAGNAAGVRTGSFATARFPHWVHRIRFRCTTCHMDLFEPRAGTNAITMVDIEEGRACGECHNGEIAFRPEMSNCIRCHVPPDSPATPDGTHP